MSISPDRDQIGRVDRVDRLNFLICKISSLSPAGNNALSSLSLIAQPNQAIEISL